ncbi:unnamed protein product [Closterium sp. Yama58-4]|nr:unnamed protein product [Closterium sp. Yama58-4]
MAARVIRAPESFFEPPERYSVPSSSAIHYQRSTEFPDGDYHPAAHPAANPADAHCSSAAQPRFIAPPLDASCFQSPTFDWSLSTFDGSPSALDDYSFEAENLAIEAFQSSSPHSLLPSYASHDFAERDADGFADPARHRYPSAASWSGGNFNAAPFLQNPSANRRAHRASRGFCVSRISRASPRGSCVVPRASPFGSCVVPGSSASDCATVTTHFGDTVAWRRDGCVAAPSPTPAVSAAACARGMIVQAAGARRRPAIGIKKLRELEAAKQRTANQAAASADAQAHAPAHAQVAAAAEANAVAVAQAEAVAEATVGTAAEEVPQLRATRTVRRPLQAARSNSTPPEVTEMAAIAANERGRTHCGAEAERAGDAPGEAEEVGGTATMMATTTCMGHTGSRSRTNREERAAILGLDSTSAPPEMGEYDNRRDSRLSASNCRGAPAMFPPPVARRRPSLESLESPHQASSSRSPSQSPSVQHAPSLQSRYSLPPLQSHLHRHRNSQSRSRSPSPSPSPLQSNRARSPFQAPLHRHSSQPFAEPFANSSPQRFSEDWLRPIRLKISSLDRTNLLCLLTGTCDVAASQPQLRLA